MLNGVFWGFLVAFSSTALVLKLMDDARDIETPHGTHTLTILLLQDIAFIPMMLLLPVLAGQTIVVSRSAGDFDRWQLATNRRGCHHRAGCDLRHGKADCAENHGSCCSNTKP